MKNIIRIVLVDMCSSIGPGSISYHIQLHPIVVMYQTTPCHCVFLHNRIYFSELYFYAVLYPNGYTSFSAPDGKCLYIVLYITFKHMF